jgi:hypothetical protein
MSVADKEKESRMLQKLLSSSTFMHMPSFNEDHEHGHVHGPSCNHGHDHDHADHTKSPAKSSQDGTIGE